MRKTDRLIVRMGAAHNEVTTRDGTTIPFESFIPNAYFKADPSKPKAGHIASALKDAMGLKATKPPKRKHKKERPDAAKPDDKRQAAEPGQAHDGPKRPRRRRRSHRTVSATGPGQP